MKKQRELERSDMVVLDAVYVAYLTCDYRLIDAYPIRFLPSRDLDAMLSMDMGSRTGMGRQSVAVSGLAAELLFIAVSGRMLDVTPKDADPDVAWQARRALGLRVGECVDFAAAYAAVSAWGDFIKPWFGCVALDSEGGILVDDPRYDERVDIPIYAEGLEDEYGWLFRGGRA